MTTSAIGTASMIPNLSLTTIMPARLTTSMQSLSALQAAQLQLPPSSATPSQIVTGNVTMIPDAPGFTVFPPRLQSIASQFDAIESAATNTAAAFGINQILASDTATIEQLTLVQENARVEPSNVITQVIIPP
jgi:hypothetical protein